MPLVSVQVCSAMGESVILLFGVLGPSLTVLLFFSATISSMAWEQAVELSMWLNQRARWVWSPFLIRPMRTEEERMAPQTAKSAAVMPWPAPAR